MSNSKSTEELRNKLRSLPRTDKFDSRYPIDAYEDDLIELLTQELNAEIEKAEARGKRIQANLTLSKWTDGIDVGDLTNFLFNQVDLTGKEEARLAAIKLTYTESCKLNGS